MPKHYCGICRTAYPTAEEARACKANGRLGPVLQPGLVLKADSQSQDYAGLVLVLKEEIRTTGEQAHRRAYLIGLEKTTRDTEGHENQRTWGCAIRDSTTIQIDIRTRKLRVLTPEELLALLQGLSNKTKTFPLKRQILEDIGVYDLTPKNRYP